jgi:2-hydroxychromene-2-carboxylate isomerase
MQSFNKKIKDNNSGSSEKVYLKIYANAQKEDMVEIAAEAVVLKCLKYFGINEEELRELPKSDEWKQLICV